MRLTFIPEKAPQFYLIKMSLVKQSFAPTQALPPQFECAPPLPTRDFDNVGTDGGGRTHTLLRVLDFESSASANSATSAPYLPIHIEYPTSSASTFRAAGRCPLNQCGQYQRISRNGKRPIRLPPKLCATALLFLLRNCSLFFLSRPL